MTVADYVPQKTASVQAPREPERCERCGHPKIEGKSHIDITGYGSARKRCFGCAECQR